MSVDGFEILHPFKVYARRGEYHSRFSSLPCAAATVAHLGFPAFCVNGAVVTDHAECLQALADLVASSEKAAAAEHSSTAETGRRRRRSRAAAAAEMPGPLRSVAEGGA